MFAFFITIHVIVSVALILVVLLQAGRGGGLAGFGAGTAQTFFGGRGAVTFLAKATSWLAVAFMSMSVLLAVLSSRNQSGSGLLQQRARARSTQAQLPPSTSSFSPGALDSSAPPVPAPAGSPVVPAPAAPPTPAPGAGDSK